MSPSIGHRGSQTRDGLAEVCKLAWHTFYGMQKASEDFENLRFEVWTMAISLDSLHSVGSTSLLIDRQPDNRRWALTFSKILSYLNAALRPLYSLVKLYLSTPAKDRTAVRQWLINQDVNYDGVTIQDFRRKLSMLVETLNVFLSSLTHAELVRARSTPETEEYRVMSEVTRTVLQKWDNGNMDGSVHHATEGPPKSSYLAPINDHLNESSISPMSSVFFHSDTEGPQSPSWPSHLQSRPSEMLDLEGIETGFRRHMHAMRRIRAQLRHQREDEDHISNQRSPRLGDAPGTRPRTSTLDSAPSSENSPDSSNSSTSSTHRPPSPTIISTFHEDTLKSPAEPHHVVKHTRTLSADSARKRGRSQDDEATLERVNQHVNLFAKDRKSKSELEQTLSAALFFDSF